MKKLMFGLKDKKGITLISLVVTITIIVILSAVAINVVIGNNGLIAQSRRAAQDTKIASYKEKIDLIRLGLEVDNKGDSLVTVAQLKEKLDKESWVKKTEEITDDGIEKLKLTTKEGFIFYVTALSTEYKGKGEVQDTSALKRNDVIKIEIVSSISIGYKFKITDISGSNIYGLQYKIDENGTWTNIRSKDDVEVAFGKTVYARLTFGSDYGIEHRMAASHSEPTLTVSEVNLSDVTRKTDLSFAELFQVTWGSEGAGRCYYSVTGTLTYNNKTFTASDLSNVSDLELGTYTISCSLATPSNIKEGTALLDGTWKKTVKITKLASTTVTDDNAQTQTADAIYSEYDLAYFRDLVNEGNSNKNAKQMNDIDLTKVCSEASNISWETIGSAWYNYSSNENGITQKFEGIFDGNNCNIYNLYINNTVDYVISGLFASNNGIIKNVKLASGNVSSISHSAGVCGLNFGKIINCDNYCDVKGAFIAAGITGQTNDLVEHCSNYGKIEVLSYDSVGSRGVFLGGIVGWADGSVTDCKNLGSIKNNYAFGPSSKHEATYLGGIVAGSGNCIIERCINGEKYGGESGLVTSVNGVATRTFGYGGIVGGGNAWNVQGYITKIIECCNYAPITVGQTGGGICGWGYNTHIESCYNMADITSTGVNAAGITSWLGNYGSMKNCYDVGNTISTENCGLLLGGYEDTITLTNNYSLNISGKYNVGASPMSGAWSDWVGHVELKDANTLKGMAATLGNKFKADYTGSNSINGGYPIFTWQ